MRTSRLISLGFTLVLTASALGIVACSSDDTTTGTGTGGSAGTGGTGGGGTGGAGTGGSATEGGTGGAAGKDASADATDGKAPDAAAEAGRDAISDVVGDCGTPGVIHTAPTVPAGIAVQAGVTLLAGYRGSGNQIYTCTPTASDGGTDAALGGTWVNTAVATLYGDNCTAAVSHTYTATTPPSPRWTKIDDGSAVVGARVNAVAAPANDAAPPAIPWLLLRAASNSGEGMFTNVTFIQRVDTAGGVGPTGACDPNSDAGAVMMVPYSATYYFYTGTPTDAGNDAASGGDAPTGSDAPTGNDAAEAGDAASE